jgi:hypothetical protein
MQQTSLQHPVPAHPEEAGDLVGSKEKLELVQRVVGSSSFSRSPAMRAFLLYITEHALANRYERIKEQAIGTEVLGRRPNYDPAEDNIVRVRAHDLRQRLEKYFATEGAQERCVITIPKGTYKPEFLPRITIEEPPPLEISKPLEAIAPAPPVPAASRRRWLVISLAVNLALLVVILLVLFQRRSGTPANIPQAPSLRDFWAQIFNAPEGGLKIVSADTGFALWQDLSGHDLNLGDYLSRRLLSLSDPRLREVAIRRSTSPADVIVTTRLAVIARAFGSSYNVQYARDIDSRSFQDGNVALIGSHRSNPWMEVFEPELNFVVERDPTTGAPSFRNRAPYPGELERYSIPTTLDVEGGEQQEFESYGVVALLRPCNGSHFAVLLEGLNMQATEAAGEIVTNAQALSSLLQDLQHTSGTNVKPFEALIQIKSLPGGYAGPKVIAYRRHVSGPCKTELF